MPARGGLFRKSYQDARSRGIDNPFDVNSPNCYDARGSGDMASKLAAVAGATSAVNLFLVTGLVRLLNFVAIFEDVTEVTDIDDVHLDVWDGASTDLTLATNPDCSGVTLNSALIKADDATGALILMDSANAAIEDTTKQQNLTPVLINAKEGTATYIRLNWVNADTNLDCQIRCYVEWRTFCGTDGNLTAV